MNKPNYRYTTDYMHAFLDSMRGIANIICTNKEDRNDLIAMYRMEGEL